MKKTISTLILAALPGLALADLADFGTTTNPRKTGGFEVTGVFQDSPASALGIKEGDIVTRINGRTLQPTSTLARLVAGLWEPNSEISIDWTRDGTEMNGKATLTRDISEEDFEARYPKGGISPSPKTKNPVVRIGKTDDLEGLPEEIEKQLSSALKDHGLGQMLQLSLGGGSASVSITQIMTTPDGDRIKISKKDDGSAKVTITSPDGKTIFDDTITEDDLDKVPEAQRPHVKMLLKDNIGVNLEMIQGGMPGQDGEPEKDATELLKDIEEEEESGE